MPPSMKPSSARAGVGNGVSAELTERDWSRPNISCRAAAMAIPSSAICVSIAASHAGSKRPSERSRLRLRMERSKSLALRAWVGSSESTSRSRKRRRSDDEPVNSPSIDGVSHNTFRWSESSSVDLAGVLLILSLRLTLSPSPGSVPVPIATSPCIPSRSTKMAKPPSAPTRVTSVSTARLKPRPGERKDIASIRLVLPAPFSPVSTTCLLSSTSEAAA
ncbi:hypothetical protein D3C71_340680 [compost metagenome]